MSDRLNRIDFVVKKYRLAELTRVESEEGGKKLGEGSIMDDATFQRFMDGDPSGNLKYLDWMIFQAGGGQDAMEKSLQLWQGESESDPNSLRNQCLMDFVDEQLKGYKDEAGRYHPPVTRDQAARAWKDIEERSRFEFIMGDQDVAMEEGFGFFRRWPGKNKLYEKIVNSIKLWHMAQPKLLAQNQRHARFMRLQHLPEFSWTKDEAAFMNSCRTGGPVAPAVVLDIYSGWKPKEFSQAGATYKTLRDLTRTLADVRKLQILRDVRFEKIYEDDRVLVVCPLTIGASIKFGLGKWCVCNRTEFDRSFETNGAEGNWQRYCKQGPLVFMNWKVPMPAHLHKIALHIHEPKLRTLNGTWGDINWIDCRNESVATHYSDAMDRIMAEGIGGAVKAAHTPGNWSSNSDETFYQWGGRKPGRAWFDRAGSQVIEKSMFALLNAVSKWAPTFRPERIVLDYVTDVGGVDNVDE